MNSTVLAIISAILSGMLATIITLLWQNRNEKIRTKKEIFTVLMAYRFKIAHAESVKALNCVQAVFYDSPAVQNAWKLFLDAADKKPYNAQDLVDAHIQLLEEISKDLNYKNINWKDIKRNYYPDGLSSQMNEEEVLRKTQVEMALINIEEAKKATSERNSSS